MADVRSAFQANAFNNAAFQNDALPAFYAMAFERDAFQAGQTGPAFQFGAFQANAFLVTGTDPTVGGRKVAPFVLAYPTEDEDAVATLAALLAGWPW